MKDLSELAKEAEIVKKPVLVFTIADEANMPYAKMLENSFKKFHPDVPFKVITGDELKGELKIDPHFFYRATPIIAQRYIKEYELVLKIDADSIITGSLDYVLNTKDYDVGTVMNWNRVDPKTYGVVQGWGILPVEYMNCGFVAMRSEEFVKQWKNLCFTPQFDRMQYREQDLLNALIYFGNWNVRCFDHGDKVAGMSAWWGLIAKGELSRAELQGDKIIIPKADDNFPKADVELKVIHAAGGSKANKMNYRTWVNEKVADKIEQLVS